MSEAFKIIKALNKFNKRMFNVDENCLKHLKL